MEKTEQAFLAILFVGVGAMVFFMGSSITGMVVQSAYCDDDGCREYCDFDTDCVGDEVCCDVNGFGVCEDLCEDRYEFIEGQSMVEKGSPNDVAVYLLILGLICLIGLVYVINRHKA